MKPCTVVKFFADIAKEERFINEMNKSGLKLASVMFGCVFRFEPAEKEQVTVIRSAKKDNIGRLLLYADECGFVKVPDRYDIVTDMLYLSADAHNERADEFIGDTGFLNEHRSCLRRSYGIQALLCFALVLIMLPLLPPIVTILSGLERLAAAVRLEYILISAFYFVFVMFYAVLGVRVAALWNTVKNKQ